MMSTKDKSKQKDKSASNFKLITTTTGIRVSQACDRCRIKKIKCNGLTPCLNCEKIGFDCKTSDKLTRRAFPKGYTENLEKKLKDLEEENKQLKIKFGVLANKESKNNSGNNNHSNISGNSSKDHNDKVILTNQSTNQSVQINNPIDQIFNLDNKGIIIGNDNLNFESQFNHLLINLNLPFLKITNSHNYLLNDPNSYLYNPSYTNYNQFHNRDLDVIYNPLTGNNSQNDELNLTNNQLPLDIYDLFIKLINNFKKLFDNKKELDSQITQFFLNYNIFIPIFDYKEFMESYDAFHTMYPFMFTYDDATINGFNISNNDYQIVNQYFMTVIQIYAMIMMNDPTINLNLLLNHSEPYYSFSKKLKSKDNTESIIRSLYDFLPYFNVFHVSVNQLQTYLLFLYYSLLTNNKEKSLVLSSLVNSFIGILGINLNSKNLFFNDLSLNLRQKRNRVKVFWVFKVLLKCFNLKFGFKPSLNTTVINPVTIDRYFQLTPEKLSSLLDSNDGEIDELFKVLLMPSIEFLNLVNIIIPSSFSPNYYQYLKHGTGHQQAPHNKKQHSKQLDWILNDDDGDGNDGNLNYNFTQFLTIDKNLSNWRSSLKEKTLDLTPLQLQMNLPVLSHVTTNDLYHELKNDLRLSSGITQEGLVNYYNSGKPDVYTASQLIKIQLNFHYLLIRSMNYLNFIIDKELTYNYYLKIASISKEILNYFLLIYEHIGQSEETIETKNPNNIVIESFGLDVDEDGFVINDFSVKRRRTSHSHNTATKRKIKEIPPSPFNYMLNGLSMTIINFKKSIILQMLNLLICNLKFFSKNEFHLINDSISVLSRSVDLFIKIFMNYQTDLARKDVKKIKEDELFKKLMNDELKDQILKDNEESDDDDDDDHIHRINEIDWDDEEMDEDLKYLKILKFIQYKSSIVQENAIQKNNSIPNPSQITHHHHIHENKMETVSHPPSINNFYSSPNSLPNFNMINKIPSISKFEYLLTDSNFPSHTMTSPNSKSFHNDELIQKEKLVINDLISLKHGGNQNNKIFNNNQWGYGSPETTNN